MENPDLAAMIQYSLAPGVMISSSALFLLSLQNRFSNLFSRFRVLNHERRVLEKSGSEKERLHNLIEQLDRLILRTGCVKSAILCLYLAVASFVGTVLSLFLEHFSRLPAAGIAATAFLSGVLLILVAVIFMIREITLASHILLLERRT